MACHTVENEEDAVVGSKFNGCKWLCAALWFETITFLSLEKNKNFITLILLYEMSYCT